jgi:hydroxylamine reductase (hybrid-cluster protein)
MVHDGDLPGWAAKADKAELEPVTEGLPEADGGGRGGGGLACHGCMMPELAMRHKRDFAHVIGASGLGILQKWYWQCFTIFSATL